MDWLSIIPPIVAIIIVFWKKEVISALLIALVTSEILLLISDPERTLWLAPMMTVDRIVDVAGSGGNTRILLFSVLVGALLALIRDSGGVTATVQRIMDLGIAKTRQHVGGLTMFTGIAVFVESNLSVLSSGILARGLFDKFKMSRARLAYIIDSTSAPICILILLNGWGAFVLGLISNYQLKESAVSILWGSVWFNFYALFTLAIVGYTIITDKVHGPMQVEEDLAAANIGELNRQNSHPITAMDEQHIPSKSRFMLLPLITMVLSMLGFMFWTGNGDLTQGSGSRSVLYATTLATLLAFILVVVHRRFTQREALNISFKGMGELLPLVTIVLLSISLGASLKVLGTGIFVAGLVGEYLPIFLVVPMLFIAGGIMSFTTGTSWGTFAILIPIGIPLVQTLGLPPSLVVAAILSGGIFGDHCSPISDTTAVSSLAAGCDLLTHVKTQLPYALLGGGLSVIAFTLASLITTA
ncbi:MAG: sodium:proton antiporter [Glaciecola sp.]|nr:sodium:proton antiporter [Glaciecola sp.]